MSEIQTTNEISSDERTMALLAHLSAFVLMLIGPAIILMVKGKESKFVEYHAKQALIYQGITFAVNFIIIIVVSIITCGMCFPVFFLPMITAIYGIFIGIEANKGRWVGYKGLDHMGLPEGQTLDS